MHASKFVLLRHNTQHGTVNDCLNILKECGYKDNGVITSVVKQVGTMKLPDGNGGTSRQPVMVSHYGEWFQAPVRKAVGLAFGTSGKNGKEYMRANVENGTMRQLTGVPEGLSSPFITASFYKNFARVGVVFDDSSKSEVVTIAASRNVNLPTIS